MQIFVLQLVGSSLSVCNVLIYAITLLMLYEGKAESKTTQIPVIQPSIWTAVECMQQQQPSSTNPQHVLLFKAKKKISLHKCIRHTETSTADTNLGSYASI